MYRKKDYQQENKKTTLNLESISYHRNLNKAKGSESSYLAS